MMAGWDTRQDEDGRGWQDDDWKGLLTNEHEQEDALFKSLDEDELEDAHEPIIDEFFVVMQPMDVPLELVERLSWDAMSQGSRDEDDGRLEPTCPSCQVDIALQENAPQSTCSETSSPRPSLSTRLSLSSCQRRFFFEPEPEQKATEQVKASSQQMTEEGEKVEEQEQKQQEGTVRDQDMDWSSDANSIVSSPVVRVSVNPFVTYQPVESAEVDYPSADSAASDSESDEDNRQSALHPSLLPRVPSIAQWRRQKSRACSAVGLTGTPTALYPATFKASLSRSRNQSVDDEDDGDFSSDDEGYTPELHRCRASETEYLDASQWRQVRHMSINFPSHRLSMNPAMMTKRLQEAKDMLNSGLKLLRSGSIVSTVMSEESYLESPVRQEIKSAPAGTYREPSIFSDKETAKSLVSAASVCTIDSDMHHSTRQQQLRAGVFRAAGLLNAASAEAARKLKSRGFRRQKAASETEDEELELSSTDPAAQKPKKPRSGRY